MANNNIGTLFHYTKNADTLMSILREGFRITYCAESFSNSFRGIPMVSFCDIPLSRTDKHRKDYGQFVVGLDKEKLLSNNDLTYLNPVIYCHSKLLERALLYVEKGYENILSEIKAKTKETDDPLIRTADKENAFEVTKLFFNSLSTLNSSNSILGFTKPYKGVNKKGKEVVFYNEREWRFVIPEGSKLDGENCKWLNEKEYKEWRGNERKPKKLYNTILPIDIEYITHIIVQKDDTIPLIIDNIWKSDYIFNRVSISDKQKRVLISRITSFQRITKDF